jgi:hypothetical protein
MPRLDTDRMERAAEVADRDPERAAAILQTVAAPGVGIDPGAVMQLVGTLMETVNSMRAELAQVKAQQPGVKTAPSPEDLQRWANQEQFLRDTWASEPKVAIHLEPTPEEAHIAEAFGQEYPPDRMYETNGVKYFVPVGRVVQVPEPIAQRIDQERRRRRPIEHNAPQGLDSIPRPPRAYLATEAGYPGNLGRGALAVSAPLSPEPLGTVAR